MCSWRRPCSSRSVFICVVAHRLGELHRDFVEAVELGALLLHGLVDVALHVLRGVEHGLLRQEADARPLVRPGLALKFGVDPGHDAEQRRLAGAVRTEHADFRAGIERQPDVVKDDARRRNHLAQGLHYIDELRGHYGLLRFTVRNKGLHRGRVQAGNQWRSAGSYKVDIRTKSVDRIVKHSGVSPNSKSPFRSPHGDSHMNRFIRQYLFVAVLLPVQAARGQSLDIGGIEIALGENTSAALERLRKSFEVLHIAVLDSGTAKTWAVLTFGRESLVTGSLREMSGSVVRLSKNAVLPSPRAVAVEYIKWDTELRRRSGNVPCKMTYESHTASSSKTTVLSGIVTTCGRYSMSLNTPSDLSENPERMGGWSASEFSISMEVHRP